MSSRRVAVIGSGVAGLSAAYAAHGDGAEVTLYEADTRLGGHADTHVVPTPDGEVAIDTGFIVHNERTYPVLLGMLRDLGVATQESEMSMSIRDDAGNGLEWAGALGFAGLFGSRRTLHPAHVRMLVEIPRFHRMARRLLDVETPDGPSLETFGEFLDRGRFSARFRIHFAEPLVGAVWSTDPARALDYPAHYLFRFLDHHGMLSIFGSPQWRTVTGGSHEYVRRVAALLPDVRTGTKVLAVVERADKVVVTDDAGAEDSYDTVVIATHPHQALAMLASPTDAQREVLGALTYTPNTAQLHTDTSVLPRHTRARASWNYLRRPAATPAERAARGGPVTITYDLTRLMRLPLDAAGTRYLVTLGGLDLVDPTKVIDTMEYEHPLYTRESVAAQARLGECESDRLAFAGAYHGWGFHEDGARSGLEAARRLGLAPAAAPTSTAGAVSRPVTPSVFRTTVRHTRRRPWHREFTLRSHTWLVDLDHLPDHGRWSRLKGSFEAVTTSADPAASLRTNVEAFLDLHGVALDRDGARGRIWMAAQPRAYGYCFNPISVFWCFAGDDDPDDPTTAPAAVIVEVHNTYGERHAYLVHPDAQGRATTPKAMYVSPFHGTDGTYEVAVPVPRERNGAGRRLDVAVTLITDDGARFSASLSGRREERSRPAWRAAPQTMRGAVLIRLHGIWLWARRLRIRPRPQHHQEGV